MIKAFLFYPHDFLIGTTFMSLEETGAYIVLLCHLADKEHLTEAEILKLIPKSIWDTICCKFELAPYGYFNVRLRIELAKRKNYAKNRANNLHMGDHMEEHMGKHMDLPRTIYTNNILLSFTSIWERYPSKVGRQKALEFYVKTVKTEKDKEDINVALDNYLQSERVKNGFIQNGKTWFADWQGWLRMPPKPEDKLAQWVKPAGRSK